jgi:hypothetical protein
LNIFPPRHDGIVVLLSYRAKPTEEHSMRMTLLTIACGAGLFARGRIGRIGASGASKRALDASDFERLLSVEAVACSADGILDRLHGRGLGSPLRRAQDERLDDRFPGQHGPQADGAREESASDPKFSPDGRYVAFLSERKDDTKSLYLLDRRGGEAQPLDGIAGDVAEYAWSPDGARLVISMSKADEGGGEDPAADRDRSAAFQGGPRGLFDRGRPHAALSVTILRRRP